MNRKVFPLVAVALALSGCGDLQGLLEAALKGRFSPLPGATAGPGGNGLNPAGKDCYVTREVPAQIFHVRPGPADPAPAVEAWLYLEAPVGRMDEPIAGSFKAEIDQAAKIIRVTGNMRRADPNPEAQCPMPLMYMLPKAATVSIPVSAGAGTWLVQTPSLYFKAENPPQHPLDQTVMPEPRSSFQLILREAGVGIETVPSLPFRTLLASVHSFYEGAQEMAVFRTRADLDAFLSRHPHRNEALPVPNFDSEFGIIALLGAQTTGAIRVQIGAIEDLGDRLAVHVFRILPPPDSMSTDDIGYPLHYVAIPGTDKPIEFLNIVDLKGAEVSPDL